VAAKRLQTDILRGINSEFTEWQCSATTGHLEWIVDRSINYAWIYLFIRYFDNKDIMFLRIMVFSGSQRNGAVFSFPHLFAQALPPADHNKNIHNSLP